MTAPVSLAELRYSHSMAQDSPHGHHTSKVMNAFPALVELAEAYLAVLDFDERQKGMGFGGEELQQAHERLALAAKGVRP